MMKESLTGKQLKELRRAMHLKVLDAALEFEKATGVRVTGFSVERMRVMDSHDAMLVTSDIQI